MPKSLSENPLSELAYENVEVSFLGAEDPVWKDLKPDDAKAYVKYRICTSLPVIHGPEKHGRFFGFHPQVLANSYRSLLHQQNNIGHELIAHGSRRDRIVGTVVGVAFPRPPRGVAWEMPDNPSDAPAIEVVAVIHKKAQGVADFIGKHQTAKQKQSVSIETMTTVGDLCVFDPGDRSIVPLKEAAEKFQGVVTRDEKNGIQIGKAEGRQLAFAVGGLDGEITFSGVGYTPTPAERTAKIIEIQAARGEEVLFAAIASHEWEEGQAVKWVPIFADDRDAGRGTVAEVIYEGSVMSGGVKKTADASNPLLRIKVHGKRYDVIRSAASVKKM